MKIVALQFDIAWENKPVNFETVRSLLGEAALESGSLVALPEMFATGFSMNSEGIAETQDGETAQFLAATARKFQITLLGGVAARGDDGQPRNQALAFSPTGELVGAYSKMRLFTPGQEDQHYAAGEYPAVFKWSDLRVSPFICYDVRFPELFRIAAGIDQPELFVVIANFPAKRIAHWIRLLQARAIENQAYVMGVNRIGTDPFYQYNGHSLIIDPQGEIVADAGESPRAIQARLDLENLKKYRAGLPFLRDCKQQTRAN